MKGKNELVIAFTLGSIIDTKKAEKVFEEKGTKAYHEILQKHREKSSIFDPGPALGTMMALRRLDRSIPDEVLKINFVLVSKNDPNPSIHAVLVDSMNHYLQENKVENEGHNYGFDMIAMTNGSPVVPFLEAVEADLIFTTSEDSAKRMFLKGINSVCIPNTNKETNLELYERRHGDIVIFSDYDGVMGDADSEKVFQAAAKATGNSEAGVNEFLNHEERFKDIPMRLGPLGTTIQKISRAVSYQKELQMRSGEKQDIEIKIIVVTARSGQASTRFEKTIEHYGIEVSESYMMKGRDKNLILSALGTLNSGNTLLFFDDSQTHFTRSLELADIASIWVPNDENTPTKDNNEDENLVENEKDGSNNQDS